MERKEAMRIVIGEFPTIGENYFVKLNTEQVRQAILADLEVDGQKFSEIARKVLTQHAKNLRRKIETLTEIVQRGRNISMEEEQEVYAWKRAVVVEQDRVYTVPLPPHKKNDDIMLSDILVENGEVWVAHGGVWWRKSDIKDVMALQEVRTPGQGYILLKGFDFSHHTKVSTLWVYARNAMEMMLLTQRNLDIGLSEIYSTLLEKITKATIISMTVDGERYTIYRTMGRTLLTDREGRVVMIPRQELYESDCVTTLIDAVREYRQSLMKQKVPKRPKRLDEEAVWESMPKKYQNIPYPTRVAQVYTASGEKIVAVAWKQKVQGREYQFAGLSPSNRGIIPIAAFRKLTEAVYLLARVMERITQGASATEAITDMDTLTAAIYAELRRDPYAVWTAEGFERAMEVLETVGDVI